MAGNSHCVAGNVETNFLSLSWLIKLERFVPVLSVVESAGEEGEMGTRTRDSSAMVVKKTSAETLSEMVVQLRKVVFVRNGPSEQSGRLIELIADHTTSSSKPTGNVGFRKNQQGTSVIIVFSNL